MIYRLFKYGKVYEDGSCAPYERTDKRVVVKSRDRIIHAVKANFPTEIRFAEWVDFGKMFDVPNAKRYVACLEKNGRPYGELRAF